MSDINILTDRATYKMLKTEMIFHKHERCGLWVVLGTTRFSYVITKGVE